MAGHSHQHQDEESGHSHGHGQSCKGGHSHGHAFGGKRVMPFAIVAASTVVLFWFFVPSMSWSATLLCFAVLEILVFNGLLIYYHINEKKEMISSGFNYLSVLAACFLISLLFVDFRESPTGFPQKLVYIDCRNMRPKTEYIIDVVPLFKEAGATGLLIDIPTDDTDLLDLMKLLKQTGLDIVPYAEDMPEVEYWKAYPSTPVIMTSSTYSELKNTKEATSHLAWALDAREIDITNVPTKLWREWEAYPSKTLWIATVGRTGYAFPSTKEQLTETSAWVSLAQTTRVPFAGMIVMPKDNEPLPLSLPTTIMQLEVLKQNKNYRFIKSKVFGRLGLDVTLSDREKTIRDIAVSSGRFPGSDAYRLAGEYHLNDKDSPHKTKLNTALKKYYNRLPENK
ncbi:hypothetical protein PROFUN_02885 [Planoprotostelium fungivorum]|uniref:Uncharacterized protein n=1 Tax=Planoprotostelium fungivorum TaxID=1890364 RepID=A0A2P6NS06_9EUKA|nr:hypothetical protein PROFUN_02885 [Planoprotostelium fungivorum]